MTEKISLRKRVECHNMENKVPVTNLLKNMSRVQLKKSVVKASVTNLLESVFQIV